MINFTMDLVWSALANVLIALLPLLVFAVAVTAVVYVVFVMILARAVRVTDSHHTNAEEGSGQTGADQRPAAQPMANVAAHDLGLGLGAMSGVSYILMTALFGVIIGMLANQLGGLEALSKDRSSDAFLNGLVSTVVLALAVVGGLFLDKSDAELRRPMGAVAFLTCFLVSGLYWSTVQSA